MMKRIADYLGNVDNAGKLKKLLYIGIIIVAVADMFAPREHAAFFWDNIPAWSVLFGVISIILIIAITKILGFGLRKKEDYYD